MPCSRHVFTVARNGLICNFFSSCHSSVNLGWNLLCNLSFLKTVSSCPNELFKLSKTFASNWPRKLSWRKRRNVEIFLFTEEWNRIKIEKLKYMCVCVSECLRRCVCVTKCSGVLALESKRKQESGCNWERERRRDEERVRGSYHFSQLIRNP